MPRAPIGSSKAAATARTSTVRLLTLPRLFGRFRRGGASARQSWNIAVAWAPSGAWVAPQRYAAAGPGSTRTTITAARHAAAPALARRLPLQAPRRGRSRGGILPVICSDAPLRRRLAPVQKDHPPCENGFEN